MTRHCVRRAAWAAMVLVSAAAWACWAAEEGDKDAAKSFTLDDQDGKQVSLSDSAGKFVVLEWINWDCPFVQRHMRAGTMKSLAEKYKDKGVVWLGINTTNYANHEANKKAREKFSLPYPVLDDHEGTVGKLYGAKATPHMFVLDKTHKIAYQGAIDDDPSGEKVKQGTAKNYVDQALTELLEGKKVSTPKTNPYGCSVKYKG